MNIEQLYTGCLSEAAYYIESEGEVAIIDPIRDIQTYIDKAKKNNHTIKYIFETHFHADFVSGHVDLAKATGAKIIFGPTAKTNFESVIATDGQIFNLGNITFEVLHTPGHTMESSCFLLKDENGKNKAVFTGDTLFIGDVGRPDLAQKGDITEKDLAGILYDSLHSKILPLSDDVLIYPAHGAGSACGKNISKETFSTLGEQRKTNYALLAKTKEDFISQVTTGIMPPPQYFPKNVDMNKNGYQSIDSVIETGYHRLNPMEVKSFLEKGALIIDTRKGAEFAKGFITGSINIGIDGSFAVWVGTLVKDLSTKIIVICDEGREKEVITRLARVGYDNTIGFLVGGIKTWIEAGNKLDSFESITADKLESIMNLEKITILDVRTPNEYSAEHIEAVESFPLDFINDNIEKLDKNKKYFLHCKSGYRSMIASSILKKNGVENVVDIAGGFMAIAKTNIPVTSFVCPSTL